MESILTSIKKMLGSEAEYTHFDPDIIMHINSVFFELNRIGVGPEEGFMIEDDTTTWLDYIPDPAKFEAVKTYMYIKVKLVFDPPASSAAISSLERMADKLEWRLCEMAEYSKPSSNEGEEEIQNGE